MKIIVCVKQVPDTNEVRIDPVRGTLIREGVPSILNPDDAHALEAALALREAYRLDCIVAVISMGPPQAAYMLRECLAMGADQAYLLSSRAFGGADTCATSATLAAGIRKIGEYDLILTGQQAIDGDTAQVGPQLAYRLNLPVITYAQALSWYDGRVSVQRQMEEGYEGLQTDMPCLITCVKELNHPRYMTIQGIVEAYEKDIVVWNEEDVGLEANQCGLKASPTQVLRSFAPPGKQPGEMLEGSPREVSQLLVGKLKGMHLL